MPHLLARSHDIDMVPRGLEPRTLWLLAIRSNQLSYETNEIFSHPMKRPTKHNFMTDGTPDKKPRTGMNAEVELR